MAQGWHVVFSDDFTTVANNYSAFFANPAYSSKWVPVNDFYPTKRFSDGVHLGIFLRVKDLGNERINRIGCALQTPGAFNCTPPITGGCPGSGNIFLQFTSGMGDASFGNSFCCLSVTDLFNSPTQRFRIEIEEWEQALGIVFPFVFKLHWKASVIIIDETNQPPIPMQLGAVEVTEDQVTSRGHQIPPLSGSQIFFGFGPFVTSANRPDQQADIDFVGAASWRYS